MNLIANEIIGNTATVYMKDGSIRSGRILGIRTDVESLTALELETKQVRDPYKKMMARIRTSAPSFPGFHP
jgi:hypothetical protein